MRKINHFSLFCKSCLVLSGSQPALHFGGGQFSWTFIQWRHRAYSTVVQLFRKRSQICSFRNISKNENLL